MSDKSKKPSKPSDHIEEKATEKEAMNPDVAEKSQTDAKGKADIDKEITNASSGSLGFDEGITAIRFEIDDEGETIASKDVRSEQSDTDKSDNDSKSITLTGVLKVIKEVGDKDQSDLAQNIEEMRTQAKEKGISTEAIDKYAKETFSSAQGQKDQFERGSFKSLSPDQVDSQKPLDPNDKPEGGYDQETRADGGVTLKVGLSADSEHTDQLNQIGEILLTGAQDYLEEQKERTLGATIGTIQSIGELTMDFVNITEFVGDVIVGNKERAAEKGAKFGDSIGKTIVAGVNVFNSAHQYLYNIGFEGDYSKPFRDILFLGRAIDREWTKLPPKEQERLKYKLATDVIAGAIPIGSATKITKAQKLTTALEEAALLGNELKHGDKASKSISEVVKDLFGPKKKVDSIKTAEKVEDAETGLASIVDDVEKQLAGAGGDWPVLNKRTSDDVVEQLSDVSCTSAVGEMLSGRKMDQNHFRKLLSEPADIMELADILGSEWQGKNLTPESLEELLRRGKPWGANLLEINTSGKYRRLNLEHSVVVEGLDKHGNIKILDPQGGERYEMAVEDFRLHWTGNSVFR